MDDPNLSIKRRGSEGIHQQAPDSKQPCVPLRQDLTNGIRLPGDSQLEYWGAHGQNPDNKQWAENNASVPRTSSVAGMWDQPMSLNASSLPAACDTTLSDPIQNQLLQSDGHASISIAPDIMGNLQDVSGLPLQPSLGQSEPNINGTNSNLILVYLWYYLADVSITYQHQHQRKQSGLC